MNIQLFHLDQLKVQGDVEQRLRILDEQERERYQQSGLPFLLCRSELKRVLAQESGLAAHDIHFCYQEQGKPSCPQLPDLHFNISHSKDLLLIGTSTSPIGVDIEKRRPRQAKQLAAIAKRFMPDEQREAFITRGCPMREFYDCWCACEALIKLKGMSMWQAKQLPAYLYHGGQIHFTEGESQASIDIQILEVDENYSAAYACQVFSLPAPSI
ncbi:MAG: 4'-phosphopantetheinyl transferase superfamily protein [Akkermansia sp.]